MSPSIETTIIIEPPASTSAQTMVERINRLIHAQTSVEDSLATTGQGDLLIGGSGNVAVRFSETAAEDVVRQGLKAQVLTELAGATHIDVRHVFEFAGIDRTTVSRRAARGDVLPQEASVKAMQFTDLVAAAVDTFGTVDDASTWLTKPHPVLGGETPMQRARTPWGLQRVRSMLGALKYGAPV